MQLFSLSKSVASFQVEIEKTNYFPGEKVCGIVDIVLRKPIKYTLLFAEAKGEEETGFDTALTRRVSPGGRYTTFYKANVFLAGDPNNYEHNKDNNNNNNNDGDNENMSTVNNNSNSSNKRSHSVDENCDLNKQNTSRMSLSLLSSTASSPSPSLLSAPCLVFTKGFSPGRYNFPFTFQLPECLPPSYIDDRSHGYSRLSYVVCACLFNGKRRLAKNQQLFGVRMPVANLNLWVNAFLESGGLVEVDNSTNQAEKEQTANNENEKNKTTTATTKTKNERKLKVFKQKTANNLICINQKDLDKYLRNGNNKQLCKKNKNELSFNCSNKNVGEKEVVEDDDDVVTPLNLNLNDNNKNTLFKFGVESIIFEKRKLKFNGFFEPSFNSSFDDVGENGNGAQLTIGNNNNNNCGGAGGNELPQLSEGGFTSSLVNYENNNNNNNNNDDGDGCGEDEDNKVLFVSPLIKQELQASIYGFFKKGTINVFLTLCSLIHELEGQLEFDAIIDNTYGLSRIEKVSFALVSYVYMNSLVEEREYRAVHSKHEAISTCFNENIIYFSGIHINIPKKAPLTLLTDGYSCRTYLEVHISSVHSLLTPTAFVRTEIVIVNKLDKQKNNTNYSNGWANYFCCKGLYKNATSFPDVISPFVTEGKMKVVSSTDDGEFDCLLPKSTDLYTKKNNNLITTSNNNNNGDDDDNNTETEVNKKRRLLNFEQVVYYAGPIPSDNPLRMRNLSAESNI